MTRTKTALLGTLILLSGSCLLAAGQAARPEPLQKADSSFEQAKIDQVDIVAPKHFEKAHKAHLRAVNTFDKGGRLQKIESEANKSLELLAEARKRADLSKVVLAGVMENRQSLIDQDVPIASAKHYKDAESRFRKAAMQAEQDAVKNARASSRAADKAYHVATLKYLEEVTLAEARASLKSRKNSITKKAYSDSDAILREVRSDLRSLKNITSLKPGEIVFETRKKIAQAMTYAGVGSI